jgi:hypothetical protein
MNKKNIEKKALWLTPDMHAALKEFADNNYMKLEGAGEFLIKLGICQHQLEKKND